jgi:hypothetical protein
MECAQLSREAGEALAGTAVADTDTWVLVEHEGEWAPKLLKSPGLPAPLRDWLERVEHDVPRSRVQLIRRPVAGADAGAREEVTCYIASSRPEASWLLAFGARRVEDLVAIDVARVVTTGEHPDARPCARPLYLVCTHGKRDRCCAREGPPVYAALARVAPGDVWQTTHLGGHRFAATALCLPHGVSYGRLVADDAAPLAGAHGAGRFFRLDRVRGRTAYDAPSQAAEVAVRAALRCDGVDDLARVAVEELASERWRVRFRRRDGARASAVVESRASGASRPASCGADPEVVHDLVVCDLETL